MEMAGVSCVVAHDGDEGEASAGSSHSTRVKFIDLCLCIFRGGVRDVGARCANPVVSGHSTVR